MNKIIPITQFGYKVLKNKQEELSQLVRKKGRRSKETEMLLKLYKEQLSEVEDLLSHSKVTEFSEKEPASVQIGSRVIVESLTTGDTREYTIMSRSTADPLNGIISNESPLAQKMMTLKLGNTFKFKNVDGREESYKIKSID